MSLSPPHTGPLSVEHLSSPVENLSGVQEGIGMKGGWQSGPTSRGFVSSNYQKTQEAMQKM